MSAKYFITPSAQYNVLYIVTITDWLARIKCKKVTKERVLVQLTFQKINSLMCSKKLSSRRGFLNETTKKLLEIFSLFSFTIQRSSCIHSFM